MVGEHIHAASFQAESITMGRHRAFTGPDGKGYKWLLNIFNSEVSFVNYNN